MPPPSVGSIQPHVVVGDAVALIYCDLITPQFVSQLNVCYLNTFIHPTTFCNQVFENLYCISVEKRTFRQITVQVFDTAGKSIAFKNRKTPANFVLHFRGVLK